MCAPLVEPTEKETQFLNKSMLKNVIFIHLRNISDEQDFISFSWVSSDFRIADFLTIAYHVYPSLLNPLRLQQKSVAAKELNANNFEIYNAPVLQLQSTIFVFS